jgi:hypothetical protein
MQISEETVVYEFHIYNCQRKTEKNRIFGIVGFYFSVFFGFLKTDVGIGFGFSKYRDIGSVFGIPTQDYC